MPYKYQQFVLAPNDQLYPDRSSLISSLSLPLRYDYKPFSLTLSHQASRRLNSSLSVSHSDPPRYKHICPSPLSVFPCPLESPVEVSFLLHTTDSSLWGLDLSLGKYICSTKVSSRSENRDCPPGCPQQPSEPTCSRSLGVACSTASGAPEAQAQPVALLPELL